MKVQAQFNDTEYQKIRYAFQRGKLSAVKNMSRNDKGVVTFSTEAPRKLCIQMESIVDFGEITAAEVFGLYVASY